MQTTDIIAASKTEIELHSRHITVVISSINHVSKMDGINFIPLSHEKLREATRSYEKLQEARHILGDRGDRKDLLTLFRKICGINAFPVKGRIFHL